LSARNLTTPEDRQREKERLQDMVKEFAKAAISGEECQWLDPSGIGPPRKAKYSIDKALRIFSLQPDEISSIQFEIAQIRDVLKDSQDTQFCGVRLPMQFGDDGVERRFVCVQYTTSGTDEQSLGLLLPNPYERERFYSSMKILKWATESRRGGN
jgi:hypothetical protein